MVELPILWQRLVKNGNTCPRCSDTQQEVEQALGILAEVLRPLDIEPRLREVAIDEDTFDADPIESNHIWIAGRSVEDWIEGETGSSQCSSVCGESQCRTVSLNGVTFETIPQRLVIRAALLAVADLMAERDPVPRMRAAILPV